MIESILTISLTGLVAGFIFAMPIAGPISIIIVSNALSGRLSYSYQVSAGAAISDFVYVFIAVFGLTSMYTWYKPAIPYLFLAGAVFFMVLAVRVFRSRPELDKMTEGSLIQRKMRNNERNGLYTGFMINMLNPTLFLSGLLSSFFVISFIASLGLNTGGFEVFINDTMQQLGSFDGSSSANGLLSERLNQFSNNSDHGPVSIENPRLSRLVLSISYAFFISLGGLLWFCLLAWVLVRYRHLIRVSILSFLIRTFGISLGLISLYFGWLGVERLIEKL